jgi:hypothetical protein
MVFSLLLNKCSSYIKIAFLTFLIDLKINKKKDWEIFFLNIKVNTKKVLLIYIDIIFQNISGRLLLICAGPMNNR